MAGIHIQVWLAQLVTLTQNLVILLIVKSFFYESSSFPKKKYRFRFNRVRLNGRTEEQNPLVKLSGSYILRQITEGKGAKLDGTRKRSRRAIKQWSREVYLLNFLIGSLTCCVII